MVCFCWNSWCNFLLVLCETGNGILGFRDNDYVGERIEILLPVCMGKRKTQFEICELKG